MRLARFRSGYIQVAILLLAAILNFFQIDRFSLWNDEGFSFFIARSGVAGILRLIAHDTQPPLYYLTLGFWLGLGTSVFVIRALSATAMTLALVPLHAAARHLFNERVAHLATFLFAIAPLDVSWAQKARPYPLQVLLIACAFWGFVRVWRDGPDLSASQKIIGTGVLQAFRQRVVRLAVIDLGWFAYAVGGAMAMLTQAPAGFFLLGCNAAMAISIFRDIRRNRILLLNWIIAQLVLVVIWMLWLPTFLQQIATHLTAAQIASKHAIFLVGFGQVLGTLQGLFGIGGLWRLGPFFFPVYVGLACFAIVQIVRRRPQAWPLPVVILVPIGACLAGFFLLHPIFGYVIYTFVWIQVPYTTLIAFGILSLRPTFLRWSILALVLAGNVWGIKNVYQTATPPLDRVAAVIRANMAPGDGVVLSEAASGRWGLTYYLGPPFGSIPGLGIGELDGSELIQSPTDLKSLHRIWVIVLDGETPAVDPNVLRRSMKPTFAQRIGAFQITRFE